MNAELKDLLTQDVYTDAHEYADRVARIKELLQKESADDPATPAEIQRARDEYQNDECEIDDGAKASRTDDGLWVSAWVWLYNEPGSEAIDAPGALGEPDDNDESNRMEGGLS